MNHDRFDVKSSVTDVNDGVRIRQNRRCATENFSGRQRFRLRKKNISDVIFELFFDQLKGGRETSIEEHFFRRATNLERANELNRTDQSQFALRVEMMFQRLDDVLDVHLNIDEDVENADARRFVDRHCKSEVREKGERFARSAEPKQLCP